MVISQFFSLSHNVNRDRHLLRNRVKVSDLTIHININNLCHLINIHHILNIRNILSKIMDQE